MRHEDVRPKNVVRAAPDRLSSGDILFISSPASWELVRSTLISLDPPWYEVRNRLSPDPYRVRIPFGQEVWVLKKTPWAPSPVHPRPPAYYTDERQQPFTGFKNPEVLDPRSFWNWDPRDPLAYSEHYAVEEREWRELNRRWEASQKKRKTGSTGPRKVDPWDGVSVPHREWYKFLGVQPGINAANLKKAYKKVAFKYHPDRCKRKNASELFKKASEAYQGLLKIVPK